MRLCGPDDELMLDLDPSGAQPEELALSVWPGRTYMLEIVCWQGEDPEWRLAIAAQD